LRRQAVILLLSTALATAAAASVWAAHAYRALLSTSGLDSSTWSGVGFAGSPILHSRDTELRTRTLQQKATRAAGPFSTEWRGYLFVPLTAQYRVVIIADDRASIDIDRQRVSGTLGNHGSANLQLSRGLHKIQVRYEDEGGRQMMEVLWARGTGVPASFQPLYLIPDIRPFEEIRVRRMLSWAMPAVACFWSAVFLFVGAVLIRHIVHRLSHGSDRSFLPAVLMVASVTLVCGLWWGLPDFYGWAPDELGPGEVNDVLARHFMGGWATIYPPLHYAVLSLATAPFHALATIGLLELEQLHVNTAVFVVQRLVSVVMALGILGLVFAIGSTINPRAGAFASAIVAVALPFTYYGKTANVDVPYIFWLTMSFAFYVRMHRAEGAGNFLLFVLTGVAAIGTKDQAYGFYILPAILIVVSSLRHARSQAATRPAGTPSPRVLAAMIASAAAGLIVVENVPFNFSGFVEHLRIITGPGSQYFRMYERSWNGQARMLRDALWQLGGAMSWPIFLLAVVGAGTAWRARVATARLLLLPLLSYYVTFLAIVGYHYDRFFIGPIIILAVPLGWWLDRQLTPGQPAVAIKVAVVSCMFAYALLRVAALDALMLFDSRYTIEQWLLQHTAPDSRLAAAGHYLPRGGTLFWTPVAQDSNALASLHPDFLIVNPAYTRRWDPSSAPGEFYQALSSGKTPYRLVFRYRSYLWWSPLQFERRFSDSFDDPFSNLSKINPVMEIYGR
jgi:hypothetical protein